MTITDHEANVMEAEYKEAANERDRLQAERDLLLSAVIRYRMLVWRIEDHMNWSAENRDQSITGAFGDGADADIRGDMRRLAEDYDERIDQLIEATENDE